jgi:hypothetical protein
MDTPSVYAFLDLDLPPVAWAVMRGVLTSASANDQNARSAGFISFMHAGIIQAQSNRRLFNESILEAVRAAVSPGSVSRLRGMYFFRTKHSAEARIGDQDWPPYFQAQNLVEFKLMPSHVPTVVDANWITFAPIKQDGRLDISDIGWIAEYWSGRTYNSLPVEEMICEGIAVVVDEGVRRRCFAHLNEVFSDARIPILMARLASESGSMAGTIAPYLQRFEQESYFLSYIGSDKGFHERETIDRIASHPDSRALARMMWENPTWHQPDFSPWFVKFQLQTHAASELGSLRIESVHHTEH